MARIDSSVHSLVVLKSMDIGANKWALAADFAPAVQAPPPSLPKEPVEQKERDPVDAPARVSDESHVAAHAAATLPVVQGALGTVRTVDAAGLAAYAQEHAARLPEAISRVGADYVVKADGAESVRVSADVMVGLLTSGAIDQENALVQALRVYEGALDLGLPLSAARRIYGAFCAQVAEGARPSAAINEAFASIAVATAVETYETHPAGARQDEAEMRHMTAGPAAEQMQTAFQDYKRAVQTAVQTGNYAAAYDQLQVFLGHSADVAASPYWLARRETRGEDLSLKAVLSNTGKLAKAFAAGPAPLDITYRSDGNGGAAKLDHDNLRQITGHPTRAAMVRPDLQTDEVAKLREKGVGNLRPTELPAPLTADPPEPVGALILTGSAPNTASRPDWLLRRYEENQALRHALVTGRPTLAICGGTWRLATDFGHGVPGTVQTPGHNNQDITAIQHGVVTVAGTLVDDLARRGRGDGLGPRIPIAANSTHKMSLAADGLPPDFVVSALSIDGGGTKAEPGTVEAIELQRTYLQPSQVEAPSTTGSPASAAAATSSDTKPAVEHVPMRSEPVAAVQWHPEIFASQDPIRAMVAGARASGGAKGEDLLQAVQQRLQRERLTAPHQRLLQRFAAMGDQYNLHRGAMSELIERRKAEEAVKARRGPVAEGPAVVQAPSGSVAEALQAAEARQAAPLDPVVDPGPLVPEAEPSPMGMSAWAAATPGVTQLAVSMDLRDMWSTEVADKAFKKAKKPPVGEYVYGFSQGATELIHRYGKLPDRVLSLVVQEAELLATTLARYEKVAIPDRGRVINPIPPSPAALERVRPELQARVTPILASLEPHALAATANMTAVMNRKPRSDADEATKARWESDLMAAQRQWDDVSARVGDVLGPLKAIERHAAAELAPVQQALDELAKQKKQVTHAQLSENTPENAAKLRGIEERMAKAEAHFAEIVHRYQAEAHGCLDRFGGPASPH